MKDKQFAQRVLNKDWYWVYKTLRICNKSTGVNFEEVTLLNIEKLLENKRFGEDMYDGN